MNDNADLRKYRIELPNLIDDLDLSVYAFRLYVHIKRKAGANGGSCYEGTRKLAETCRMSVGQVSAAKKELLDKRLITKGQRDTRGGLVDEFTPVDLWQQNYARFSVQEVNTTVHTVNTNAESVHTVNVSVHTVNEGVHQVNVRKNREERTNKNREGSRAARTPPAPKQTNLDSFNEAVGIFKELSGKKQITPALMTLIVTRVTNMSTWRTTIESWASCGYNVMNIKDMLDWYDHPEKMAAKMGYSNGLGSNQAQGGRLVRQNGHRPANADIPNRPASSGQAEYERQYLDWANSDDETEFAFKRPDL